MKHKIINQSTESTVSRTAKKVNWLVGIYFLRLVWGYLSKLVDTAIQIELINAILINFKIKSLHIPLH